MPTSHPDRDDAEAGDRELATRLRRARAQVLAELARALDLEAGLAAIVHLADLARPPREPRP